MKHNFSQTKYTSRQQVLLSLIARRTDLLTDDLIEKAAWNISQDKVQFSEIRSFLFNDISHARDKLNKQQLEYFPTIVILDELADFLYWEMVCPNQEFARMTSMSLFFKLYDKYAAQLKDGYVRVKTKKGYVLSNPGKCGCWLPFVWVEY